MKKLLLSIVSIISLNAFSQTSCVTEQPFCAGSITTLSLSTDGNNTAGSGPSAPAGPSYGCLGSTPNPTFFYFQINNSGNLVLSVAGSAGNDVDAICWGPFASPIVTCDSTTGLTGGCSFGTPSLTTNNPCSGNIVDCSYSTSATETITINNAIAGQYYILLVTNFEDMPQNLVLQQIGGTASTNCDTTIYNGNNGNNGNNCQISNPASICFVNTNSTPKNEIYFSHTSFGLKGTIIYRLNASSAWDSIGYVPYNQPDEFIDTTANPNQQSYTYAVAQLDSCGTIRAKSSSHTTILLQSSVGTSGQVNLTWNAYVGAAVPSYYIYRGSTPSSMSFLAQVSSSTYAYTDLTPPAGNNYYKIDFQAPANCTSNATHDTLVGSNYKTNFTTSIDYLNELKEYKIYPNPSTNNITVYSTEIAKSIEITDVLGNTVLTLIPQNNAETISVQNFNKGIYFVKTTNSKGIFCKKLLVE